jgi:spermidine synthase
MGSKRPPQSASESVGLSEEFGVRYLHLGDTPWVQSALRLDQPDQLELEYVRQMTAWLGFLHAPPRIALLGLGGGSLARWNWRNLRASKTIALEHNPGVILAARTMFGLPADGPRLQVLAQDAGQWLGGAPAGTFGVVLVDLYDGQARGPILESEAFYQGCRNLLSDSGGIVVCNLFGDPRRLGRSVKRLRRVFAGRVLLLPPTHEGNTVALAFHGPLLRVATSALRCRLEFLEARFGWPYTAWLAGPASVLAEHITI